MRGLLVGHGRMRAFDAAMHGTLTGGRRTSRRSPSVTQAQIGRREFREHVGAAGLTGEARRLGRPYPPAVTATGLAFPMAPNPGPVDEQVRGRRRPDGHEPRSRQARKRAARAERKVIRQAAVELARTRGGRRSR